MEINKFYYIVNFIIKLKNQRVNMDKERKKGKEANVYKINSTFKERKEEEES